MHQMLPFGNERTSLLLLFDHDFRGLDDSRNGVAYFEIHLHGTSFGNDALNEIVSDLNDHMGHHSTELELRNLPFEPVAR